MVEQIYEKPYFLGVGPEKTGTSWYYNALRRHPELWMPPVKEVRYFWERQNYPGESPWRRIFKPESWHHRQYRYEAKKIARRILRRPWTLRDPDTRWVLNYLASSHDDRWYYRSMSKGGDKKCGEVSPQYFFLSPEMVAKISQSLPNVRIIITLRRPDEWAWSFIRMRVKRGFIGDDVDSMVQDLDQYISRNFSESVRKWRRYFPEDRLKIMFFDKIASDPDAFMRELCDFLEISHQPLTAETKKAVNTGIQIPIPEQIAEKAGTAWRDDIRELGELAPDLPLSWLEER